MKTLNGILAVVLLSVSSFAVAQDAEDDRRELVRIGLKAGLNYANVYNTQTDDFRADPKFGFAGGVVISVPIGKFIGVQPEVLLSQKGFKGEGVLLGSTYTFTRTTTFIDVPLLVAIKPSQYFTIVAGPQYSYLLRQKDVFTASSVSTSQEQEFDADNIRKNILGVTGGVDIYVTRFVVGARFGWDLSNNHGDGNSSTPRYRNSWFQATIGYTY